MKAKIYTKTGDQGQSSLVDGTRVPKNHVRLEAYGTLDELSSTIGLIRSTLKKSGAADAESNAEAKAKADVGIGADVDVDVDVEAKLESVQNALFNIGSRWACSNAEWIDSLPNISASHVSALEDDMDAWESALPPLKNFILSGGTPAAALAHLSRTVCRRAERTLITFPANSVGIDSIHLVYLNRLSDWFFLLARYLNFSAGVADLEWRKD